MAKALKKKVEEVSGTSLGSTGWLPLSSIKIGKFNPRKGKPSGIEGLAADIKAHGLINPVSVLEDGTLVAGHRRHAALLWLAKKKEIDKEENVPVVFVTEEQAYEVALAENVAREDMHPADAFQAFKRLVDGGMTSSDVAARYGYSERTVKELLSLAECSPKVIKAYRDGHMTLDETKAFAGAPHDRQEEVLKLVLDEDWRVKDARGIRKELNAGRFDGNDKRIRFVGWEAFEKAGGQVEKSLFFEDKFGSGEDILNSLVDAKLKKEAAKYEGKGWKFVSVIPDMDYQMLSTYGRIFATAKPLSKSDQKRLDALKEKQRTSEEFDDGLQDFIDEIESKIEFFWSEDQKSKSGVIIYLNWNGDLEIEDGRIHPDDVKAAKKEARKAEKATAKNVEEVPDEEVDETGGWQSEEEKIIPRLVSALEMTRDTLKAVWFKTPEQPSAADIDRLFEAISVALEGAK